MDSREIAKSKFEGNRGLETCIGLISPTDCRTPIMGRHKPTFRY